MLGRRRSRSPHTKEKGSGKDKGGGKGSGKERGKGGGRGRGGARARNGGEKFGYNSGEFEEIKRRLRGKLDDTALEALDEIPRPEAIKILLDAEHLGDAVRNVSPFVMKKVQQRVDPKPARQDDNWRDDQQDEWKGRSWPNQKDDQRDAKDRYHDGSWQNSGLQQTEGGGLDGIRDSLDRLKQNVDLDASASRALDQLDSETQVGILTTLVEKFTEIKNKSAFVIAQVLRHTGRKSGHDSGRSQSSWQQQEEKHSVVEASRSEGLGLNEQARKALAALPPQDADRILWDLEKAGKTVKNPSGWVLKAVRTKEEDNGVQVRNGGWSQGIAGGSSWDRHRRGGSGNDRGHSSGRHDWGQPETVTTSQALPSPVADQTRGTEEHVDTSIVEDALANSAFQLPKRQHFPQPKASSPAVVGDVEGNTATDVPATEAWRTLELVPWLEEVGGSHCVQYGEKLIANYDSLEQIVELYVQRRPGNPVQIEGAFFEDVGIEKVGHKRLFEKWFKDRM